MQMLGAVMALDRRKRQGRERLLAAIPESDSEEELDILTASHEVSPGTLRIRPSATLVPFHKQALCSPALG